jgi:hypothetical protein
VGDAGGKVVAMTTIRNADEFLSGAGLETDQVDCQTTGDSHTTFTAPWRGKQREADKTALFDYVRRNASGVPLVTIVSDVFGDDSDPGAADYKLAKRFFERYPDLFNVYDKGAGVFKWVEPQVDLYRSLRLRQQSQRDAVGQADDEAGDLQNVDTADETDQADPQYAKDRVQSYLENYLMVNSDAVKESFFEAMVTDIEGNEGLWQVLENRVTDEYLCLPYNTRHNNGGKAGKVRDRFDAVLKAATKRHNCASVVTLTTDPKRHTGLSEALENLSDNRRRLLQWLSTEYQLGYRPEYLSVLEFSRTGLPHLHLVIFGENHGISEADIRDKWVGYGQGWEVDVRLAVNHHATDTWRLHDDGDGIVALRDYLGKAIRDLQDLANSDADELRDRLEAGDLSLWRQALYWATERQYFTCSHSLKKTESDEADDGLPDLTIEWEFVGVRQYEDIPATVKEKAEFVSYARPPPSTSSTASSAAG